MWYWYISGAFTVLFIESIILNIGLMQGWIKFTEKQNKVVPRNAGWFISEDDQIHLYNQDNSGSIKRNT